MFTSNQMIPDLAVTSDAFALLNALAGSSARPMPHPPTDTQTETATAAQNGLVIIRAFLSLTDTTKPYH
jgi:hypothetical protein